MSALDDAANKVLLFGGKTTFVSQNIAESYDLVCLVARHIDEYLIRCGFSFEVHEAIWNEFIEPPDVASAAPAAEGTPT